MRPSTWLGLFISLLVMFSIFLFTVQSNELLKMNKRDDQIRGVAEILGLTDLCIATDARYIRHLSVTDSITPFMDYPGALEYFPSSSAITPVR